MLVRRVSLIGDLGRPLSKYNGGCHERETGIMDMIPVSQIAAV